MNVEKEYKEAKRKIVRQILERGLFKGNDFESVAVNMTLSRIAQKDDEFVDMLVGFLNGSVSEKKMKKKIDNIMKEMK